MHEMLKLWFGWVDQWGYWGIFGLMAMESSVIPVPSEIVMPPAAFWAAQGRMNIVGVIAAGTLGSYVGSAISYWVSLWVGRPVLQRYGKFVLIPESKLRMAEEWVRQYGVGGVFVARLLPVVRHLISIPAGLLRMPFARFSTATILGAGIWCGILSWFGQQILGRHPELLQSPEAMIGAIKSEMHIAILGGVFFAVLYGVVVRFKKKSSATVRLV